MQMGQINRYRRRFAILAGSSALIALASSASAQDIPATASTPAVSPTDGLAEIIVTAQKRSESIQRTPLAITAIDAATISDRRIEDATDINALAPNLTVTSGPSSKGHLVLFIRGIGESESILTADSPIGLYVDGVIVGRSTGAVFELVDLDRIEVLRGPQGTLYGRNTVGGAVNLITRKPSDKFGIEATASYGNYDYYRGRISVDTGELGNSGITAKLSYLHRQRGGYVDNLNAPDRKDPGADNTDAFRVAVAYDHDGPFRANYAFDFSDVRGIIPFSQLAAATPNVVDYFSASPRVGGTAFIPPSQRRLGEARPDVSTFYDRNTSHTLNLELDVAQDTVLRSITGYRTWKDRLRNGDLDGNSGQRGLVVSPAPAGVKPIQLFGANSDRKQHQISQELNLIGAVGDRLTYVVGAYYFRERAEEFNPQAFTFVTSIPGLGLAGVNLTSTPDYSHVSSSEAAFGQITYKLTEQLRLTGGLRYTHDRKKLVQVTPFPRVLSKGFNKANWAATIDYQATPNILAYARVATGYKAGGFSARSANDGYDPETLTSYEAGLKTDLFDRRLRFNATLFYMDLKDKQINQFQAGSGGALSITTNAAQANFKGVELEIDAVPVRGLRLNGNFGYVDRNFDRFVVLNPTTNVFEDVSDEAHFNYAASTTYNVGAEYTAPGPIAGGQLSLRVDYTYRSQIYFNVVPSLTLFDQQIKSPGFGLLDGRVSLADLPIGRVTAMLSLWGKNLTNKNYRTSGTDFGSLGFAVNTYGEKRTYGVDLAVKF
jgi:iron complex outermembrane receptor protein